MLYDEAQDKVVKLEVAILEARIGCKAVDKDRREIAQSLVEAFYQVLLIKYPEAADEFVRAKLLEKVAVKREWIELMAYSPIEAKVRRELRLWAFIEAINRVANIDLNFDGMSAELERHKQLLAEYEYIESMYSRRRAIFDAANRIKRMSQTDKGCSKLDSEDIDEVIISLRSLLDVLV